MKRSYGTVRTSYVFCMVSLYSRRNRFEQVCKSEFFRVHHPEGGQKTAKTLTITPSTLIVSFLFVVRFSISISDVS